MKTIDLPPETTTEPSQAVARVELPESRNGITPAQAKVEAVARLTMTAYEKASELRLTKEETDALQAVFPDEAFQPGAAGKEHLIYIEHAHLRDRFNSVFGMGQWSIVPRNRWAEPFTTQSNKEGSRVYVEAMLVVRGCFVAEAVGAMEYYPHNAGQDYSDAVEGAKTAALRRCAKELGVGLQAWKKEFCEGWWQRRRNTRQQNNSGASGSTESRRAPDVRRGQTAADSVKDPNTPAATRGGNSAPPTGTAKPPKQTSYATKESRMRFLNHINAAPGQEGDMLFKAYCVGAGLILDTESSSDLPLQWVPINKRQLDLMLAALAGFESGEEAQKPYAPNEEGENLGAGGDGESRPAQKSGPTAARGSTTPESKAAPENRSATAPSNGKRDPEWFFDAVCPVPRKGQKKAEYDKHPDTIGSMYDARHGRDEESTYLRGRLFGLMNNFDAKGWEKRDGTKMPPSQADIKFREALDALADYLESKGERI